MLIVLAGVAAGLCLWAAVQDIASLTIPNWLNASLAISGIFALVAAGVSWQVGLAHIGLAAGALAICVGMFALGVFGGGDAKMIPAVLIWLGPAALASFLAWMAIAGGVLACVLAVGRRFLRPARLPVFLRNSFRRGEGVPYGVAIAAGAFVAAPLSPLAGV